MSNSRRDFIKKSLAGTAGMSLSLLFSNELQANSNEKLTGIGLITNTVKNELKENWKKTFRKIADTGYNYLEGGSNFGKSTEKFLKFINKIGLRYVAGGTSMHPLSEDTGEYIKSAREMNREYIVCYWPWLDSAENLTREQSLKAAESLNKIGKKCKENGLGFAWHNHDKEFRDINGEMAFDIIMDNTDPEYVTCEMDIYWVKKGNQDPVHYFKKYPGRFHLLHVKDMDNTEERGIACVGNGIIDFKRIFAHAKTAGTKYFIVENEKAQDGITCMTDSYHYLSNLEF